MNKHLIHKISASVTTIGLAALLAACGGGGGTESSPTPTSSTTVSAAPLAAGQSYIGTLSFGDTIRIDLDAPGSGQVTVTFVDSQFGLAGTLTGTYTTTATTTGTSYTVTSLTAGSGAPAALAAAVSQIGLSFTVVKDSQNHAVMTGSLTSLPNIKAGTGSTLAGQIQASNNGVTSVASLAGTYSFIKLSGNYSSSGVPQGDQEAGSGQVKINPDGSVRFCSGQAYSDACLNYDQQTNTSSASTGTMTVDPNQAVYPGAFDVTMNGNALGRLLASTSGTQTSIFIDQAGRNSDGTFRTGSFVLTTARTLASNELDGTWTCTEPAVADNSNTLTGATQITHEKFAGSQITPLLSDGSVNTSQAVVPLFYNQTFDPSASQSTLTLTSSPVGGLVAGEWTGVFQNQSVTGALIFMPLGENQISYLDEVNANGFFVLGTCSH